MNLSNYLYFYPHFFIFQAKLLYLYPLIYSFTHTLIIRIKNENKTNFNGFSFFLKFSLNGLPACFSVLRYGYGAFR